MSRVKELYQDWEHGTDSMPKTPVRLAAIQRKLKQLGIYREMKVLDFGCGNASLSRYIPECDYHGFDLSHKNVKSANNPKVIQADYENGLPYADDSFDLVMMIDVIEHCFITCFALEEALRVTKPNGFLMLTTPNLASIYNRVFLMLGTMPVGPEVSERKNYGTLLPFPGQPAGHIRVMTTGALQAMSIDCGWNIYDIDSYGLAVQRHKLGWLYRIIDALLPHSMACNQLLTLLKGGKEYEVQKKASGD